MKSNKQFWYEIGQSIRAANEKRQANERERRHIESTKEDEVAIAPSLAPKLREALEKAKGHDNEEG
jgi:hypothetical protein